MVHQLFYSSTRFSLALPLLLFPRHLLSSTILSTLPTRPKFQICPLITSESLRRITHHYQYPPPRYLPFRPSSFTQAPYFLALRYFPTAPESSPFFAPSYPVPPAYVPPVAILAGETFPTKVLVSAPPTRLVPVSILLYLPSKSSGRLRTSPSCWYRTSSVLLIIFSSAHPQKLSLLLLVLAVDFVLRRP